MAAQIIAGMNGNLRRLHIMETAMPNTPQSAVKRYHPPGDMTKEIANTTM